MKILHREQLNCNEIFATADIKKDGNLYYGSWICEECGQQSGPVGITDSFDSATMNMRKSFELHVSRCHKE